MMSSKYYTAPQGRMALVLAICAVAIADTFSANAEPAMWVIRDKDSVIYLIGTVHLLKHETEWASAKLDKALAESSELWLEVPDPDNQQLATQLIQRYGMDSKKPLSQKLNFIEKEKLSKLAAEYHIPASNLETLQPWTAALIFAVLPIQKAGYDPNAGVDHILQNKAKEKGEKIEGFETLEEQIRFLADLPQKEQIAFLDDTFEDVAEGIEKLDKVAVAWVNGDIKTIDDLLVQEMKKEYPTLYEKLIVERNVRWSEKIEKMLQRSGVQLIAVGAGHLIGADSVQSQLAKRGITAEPY
jgi:hypothetical protein